MPMSLAFKSTGHRRRQPAGTPTRSPDTAVHRPAVERDRDPLLLSWIANNYWDTNFPQVQNGPVRLRYGLLTAAEPDPAPDHGVDGRVSVQLTISLRSANSHSPSCLTNSSR